MNQTNGPGAQNHYSGALPNELSGYGIWTSLTITFLPHRLTTQVEPFFSLAGVNLSEFKGLEMAQK